MSSPIPTITSHKKSILSSMWNFSGRFISLIFLLLIFSMNQISGQMLPERVFYVSVDGDDDCSDQYCGFQAALDTAAMDSADVTILVAKGVYPGNYTFDPDSGNCYGDILLEGGWDTDFQERNSIHESIVDGQNSEQPLRIVKYKGKSIGAITIDGFTVRNGVKDGSGGGMLVQTWDGDILINNNIVINNKTIGSPGQTRSGGGIFLYAFNPDILKGSKITVSNCIVKGNEAGLGIQGQGGGIFTYGTDTLLILNNIISGNTAHGGSIAIGGGIEMYSNGGLLLVANNTISGNHSDFCGGGSGTHVSSSAYKNTHYRFYNNIIYGNTKGSGYGADAFSAAWNVNPSPNNTFEYHNNLIGNHGVYPGTIIPVYENNISENPKFIDTLFHIPPSSPAVNTGLNDVIGVGDYDLDGNMRVQDEIIDMGVYEQDGLVAYYKLDGNAKDESMNHIDGVYLSGSGTGIMNEENTAEAIQADTQRIYVPYNSELSIPSEITMSMWVYPDSLTIPSYILHKGVSCQHNGNYNMKLAKGLSTDFDRPTFTYYDGVGLNKYFVSEDTLVTGRWYHLAATYNYVDHSVKLYINGNPVSGYWHSGNEPVGTAPVMTDNLMGIGAHITSHDGCNGYLRGEAQNPFYGKVDELKIYNRILEEEQIMEVFSMPPYGIELSANRLNENIVLDHVVAELSALDPNINDIHSYQLVVGDGDAQNSLFKIEENYLKVNGVINYESDPLCAVRIEVQDEAMNSFVQSFEVEIVDVNDPPVVANPIADQQIVVGEAYSYAIAENTFFDEDRDPLSYTAELKDADPLPVWLTFTETGRLFSGTATSSGDLTIVVSVEDAAFGVASDEFLLEVDPNSAENFDIDGIRIYPQPASDFLIIESVTCEFERVTIYSISGAKMCEQIISGSERNILKLNGFSEGLYILLLEGEEGKEHTKIIIR